MEILGIGPLELILILLIALIVMGPKDMAKAGRTIGSFLRKIVTSPNWSLIRRTSKEIRNLPNRLIREAGVEEELQKIQREVSIPEMDQNILDPHYFDSEQKKISQSIQSTPSSEPAPSRIGEFNAWTSEWDEVTTSPIPTSPDSSTDLA